MTFRRKLVIDGNNSLKRLASVGDRAVGDTRVFKESDYFLSREFVDKYAGEVKPHMQPDSDHDDRDIADDNISNIDPEGGDPTDGARDLLSIPCANNWKAAAWNERKQIWGAFEETGLFACACRHGLIAWIVDMVRSGEL